jgi:Domain of unknown function (DUF4468) with TBP-like fold
MMVIAAAARVPLSAKAKAYRVAEVDSAAATKDQLFAQANEWVSKTFNSYKAVVQYSDKETGKITGRFNVSGVVSVNGAYKYTASVSFTIEAKEGRVRFLADDMRFTSMEWDMSDKIRTLNTPFETEDLNLPWWPAKAEHRLWDAVRDGTIEKVWEIADDFRYRIQHPVKDNW